MGYFAELASEARRGMVQTPPPAKQTAAPPPPAAPEVKPAPPVAVPEAPAEQPAATPPAEASLPPKADPAPSAHTPPPPEVKLTVAEDAAQDQDDTAARQAHEAAEAKRKAEWDAKQAEKKAVRQKQLEKIKTMNDAELLAAAVDRVAADTEKLTRRNMKEAVAEHVQARCRENAAFAVLVMDPGKSMVNCFRYVSRKAYEYIQDELKASGIKPGPGSEGYGCDVPDDLVYQWAVDYFNDPDAEEDKTEEEKFVPKPYIPSAKAPSAAKKKRAADKKPPRPKADAGQITLGGFAPMEEKAG